MSLTSTNPGNWSKFTYNDGFFDAHWAKTIWTYGTG